jgi:hypothetical protein
MALAVALSLPAIGWAAGTESGRSFVRECCGIGCPQPCGDDCPMKKH